MASRQLRTSKQDKTQSGKQANMAFKTQREVTDNTWPGSEYPVQDPAITV